MALKSSICRLEHVVAVLIWEQTDSDVGERQPSMWLGAATRLLSCYYRSNLLDRPPDARSR